MKKLFKKIVAVFVVITMLLTSISIAPIMEVFAGDADPKPILQLNGASTITGKTVNYKSGEIVKGTVRVKPTNTTTIDENLYAPETNITTNNIEVVLPEYTESYRIVVVMTPSDGYEIDRNSIRIGGNLVNDLPGNESDGSIEYGMDITSANQIINMDISFIPEGTGGNDDGGDNPPMNVVYPIVATFSGVDAPITMNFDGSIVLPEGWTSGRIDFAAKACTVNDEIQPDDGFIMCDSGTEYLEPVRIEGIVGLSNGTVTGGQAHSYVDVTSNFSNYKKETIHITSNYEHGPVNTIIALQTRDMTSIKANAPLDMSYSVGSSDVNQAIITNDVEKELSIFFGNDETTLEVSGLDIVGITAVAGGKSTIINQNGTATVELPPLSEETTTSLMVTIKKSDNSTITRTIKIKRTAIMLKKDETTLKAGYVINKNYLYVNQVHNDEIFNAYLQVMLYKNNKVVGYKQIKIDDEGIVNSLVNGTKYNGNFLPPDAWSIETFNDDAILLLTSSELAKVDKVSVFLTDGPVNYDSDLPSIKYGVGAGLELAWEE